MAQVDRVLSYMQSRGSIQPLEAWRELGIYRLSAVIYDLRKDGYAIKTKRMEVVNRFGESAHIAQYSLDNQNAA